MNDEAAREPVVCRACGAVSFEKEVIPIRDTLRADKVIDIGYWRCVLCACDT